MAKCGAYGNIKIFESVTPEEKETVSNVLAAVVSELVTKGFDESSLVPISYSTQVVAGVNYLIKVQSNDKYFHLKVNKPLPHTKKQPFILAIEVDKSLEDPLVPFE